MVLDKIPGTEIFTRRDVRETPVSTATATSLSVVDATYLVLSNHADLTDERVLTAGEGIDFNDTGPNNSLTISGEDASITNKGIIEVATITETNTGTDAGKAVSPDGLDGWTGSSQLLHTNISAGDGSDHSDVATNSAARHTESHDAASHSDIASTGANIDSAVSLKHSNASDHAESHNIASHSDTTATGAELNTLTGGGDTTLHDHDGISENTTHRSSDGSNHSKVTANETAIALLNPIWELIEHKTFTDATPGTFSSISGYAYLVLIIDSEKGDTGADNQLYIRFNGSSTAADYSYKYITANAVQEQTTSGGGIRVGSEDWRYAIFNIQVNSRRGNKHGIGCSTSSEGADRGVISAIFNSASPITSIEFFNDGTNAGEGDTGQATLYGIKTS